MEKKLLSYLSYLQRDLGPSINSNVSEASWFVSIVENFTCAKHKSEGSIGFVYFLFLDQNSNWIIS
ncbi:hypothetical protein HanRHA438_Chr08g0356791 [Helianthus annuus]|nr:hypothetical protein HanRHA438_Chr08g0356791 [Helianthus annuus]